MEVVKGSLEGNKVKLKVEIEKERVNDAWIRLTGKLLRSCFTRFSERHTPQNSGSKIWQGSLT